MTGPETWLALALIAIAGISIVTMACLKGWNGWLELKRAELSGRRPTAAGERIEIADLKERIRKLESIAACVDL